MVFSVCPPKRAGPATWRPMSASNCCGRCPASWAAAAWRCSRKTRFHPQVQVMLTISRLDSGPKQPAVIEARWRLLDQKGDLKDSRVFHEEEQHQGSIGDQIRAQSDLLKRLAAQLAKGRQADRRGGRGAAAGDRAQAGGQAEGQGRGRSENATGGADSHRRRGLSVLIVDSRLGESPAEAGLFRFGVSVSGATGSAGPCRRAPAAGRAARPSAPPIAAPAIRVR